MSARRFALAFAAAALAAPMAFAQPTTGIGEPTPAMRQAILAGLNAETRRNIEQRAAARGNTVYGVLETELLNNLAVAELSGARLVAIDFTRQVVVLEPAGGGAMRVLPFDRETLTLRR
jgi:hypothetical protein